MNLDVITHFMRMIVLCKRFDHVDGVPTLTVGPEMYNTIKECIDAENLCRIGILSTYYPDPVITVCGVVLKLEE